VHLLPVVTVSLVPKGSSVVFSISIRSGLSLYQPFVEFLRVAYIVRVRYDGVDQPLSSLYASAAFIRQESSLSRTVDAYLTILAKPSQKIV